MIDSNSARGTPILPSLLQYFALVNVYPLSSKQTDWIIAVSMLYQFLFLLAIN